MNNSRQHNLNDAVEEGVGHKSDGEEEIGGSIVQERPDAKTVESVGKGC